MSIKALSVSFETHVKYIIYQMHYEHYVKRLIFNERIKLIRFI